MIYLRIKLVVYKSVRLPKNSEFDPQTKLFIWTPKQSQKGVHDVVLEVVDSHGRSTLQEFQVHVFPNPGAKRFSFLPRNLLAIVGLGSIIYFIITLLQ